MEELVSESGDGAQTIHDSGRPRRGGDLDRAVRKAGSLSIAGGIAALGVLAALWGMAGDAPGLVVLGMALFVSACALGVRAAHRTS